VIKNVKSVKDTPFERMISLLAIKAKCEFTVLAPTKTLIFFEACKGPAAVKWTPSKVIHLGNCIV